MEIAESMMEAEADPDVRVIIMTGAGDRAFCAGADIGGFAKDVNTRESGGRGEFSGRRTVALPPLPTLMRNLSKPTIAAINGYALGVGMTIPILFDVRIASENAKMGVIFGRVGVMAELGSTYLLPRMIGLARASEMMLTGKQYTAAECLQMGLISQVTPAGKVMEEARAAGGRNAAMLADLAGVHQACDPSGARWDAGDRDAVRDVRAGKMLRQRRAQGIRDRVHGEAEAGFLADQSARRSSLGGNRVLD